MNASQSVNSKLAGRERQLIAQSTLGILHFPLKTTIKKLKPLPPSPPPFFSSAPTVNQSVRTPVRVVDLLPQPHQTRTRWRRLRSLRFTFWRSIPPTPMVTNVQYLAGKCLASSCVDKTQTPPRPHIVEQCYRGWEPLPASIIFPSTVSLTLTTFVIPQPGSRKTV